MFDKSLFKDKVILISGATGGVGQATAECLFNCNASLSLTGTNVEKLSALSERFNAHTIVADIAKVDNCERIIAETLTKYGRIDALVNCAGVWVQGDSEFAEEKDWDHCLNVNLKGPFFLSSRAIPALKASQGSIINVGSDAGVIGNAGAAIYCASKGGLTVMSKSLAMELAPFGIRVNVICPADIMSPMLQGQAAQYGGNDPDGYLTKLLDHYPQGHHARFITPDEVAHLIVFLLTQKACPITGAAINMDFGLSAGY